MTRKRQGGYRTKKTQDRERKRIERTFPNHRNVSEQPSAEPIPEYTATPVSSANCTSPASSQSAMHHTSYASAASCVGQPSDANSTISALSSALSYHPLALIRMVGNSSTEITDDVIVAGLELIKANGDSKSVEYYGYYKPAEIQFQTLHPCAHNSTMLPINKDSLHVHPLTGHWVTSYFNSNAGQLFVYDSLQSTAHLQEVKLQLRQMYSDEIVDNVIYGRVTQQSIEPICGVLALAFAFTCFLGVSPINVNYDITKAREHLKACFESGNISQFPVLDRNECSWIYTYIENQRRLSSEHLSGNATKKLKSSIHSKTILVQDKDKNKKLDRHKGYNTEQNKSISPQQSENSKSKDKPPKSEHRNLLSVEQKEIRKAKDRYRTCEKKKLLSSQQRETYKDQNKRYQAEKRKLLSREQRHTSKSKDKHRKAEERKLLPPEQRHTSKSKDKHRKAEERKLLPPEQRHTHKQKNKCYQAEKRKLLSHEQRHTSKSKDKHRKAEERKLLPPEQRHTHKQKNKCYQAEKRKLLSHEQRHTSKSKDKHRKAEERNLLSPKQRTTYKGRNMRFQAEKRKDFSKQQKSNNKKKDKDRKQLKRHPSNIQTAIQLFKRNIKDAPEYVCTVCHRTLFRNSVNRFSKTTDLSATLRTRHISPDGCEYICCTCKRYISKHTIPPQAQVNNMYIPDTPDILTELTDFECRLLARRYPFMKIVQLPKGKQSGILGRVVNVPVDASELCSSLPRTLSNAGILPVKLKRKKTYKGHVFYQNIRPDKIKQAFQWLLKHNSHYQTVVESQQWENECLEESEEIWHHFTDKSPASEDTCNENPQCNIQSTESSSCESSDTETEDIEDITPPNIDDIEASQFDTCVQPADPAADASEIFSIAPGEGKLPINIMLDPGCEEQAFPQLFPTGCFGFDADRQVKITPKKYFNARILNRKGSFAKNTEYLFFAQYVTEHKQVMDSVSKAVRKTYKSLPTDQSIDAGFIKDPDRLKSLMLKDKAYSFLQTVRGSPPYWQKAMYKLMAAIKQFGIFTFFLTLSSADMKWLDTLNAILRQQGKHLSEEEILNLTWEERCSLLRSNPVTTARHFDHRLQCFFSNLLLGPVQVLGKVLHYSYRIEFQQRGSPHAHCILWTENAPKPTDPVETITQFIDKYISCAIPSEQHNPDLYNLVTTVQKHHHTATCRKKGTDCRFHFPRMPSPYTLIASPIDSDDVVFRTASLETAADILTHVMDTLQKDKENKIESIHDLLTQSKITMNQYIYALSLTKRGKTVILKRKPQEVFINCYNSTLLLAWQANLDLQYCLDPYACIAYMVSYITKDEREMSTVLKNVCKEMGHQDWREQLKSCANAFLNARELSAQEAVYRLLSLPLFKSNFVTVFVPADLPDKRVAFLKPLSAVIGMEDEEENVFTTSILDRYAARPKVLEGMCLAEFAVSYKVGKKAQDIDSDQEADNEMTDIIELKDNLGTMKKNSKKAVLRYHHKSQAKEPEEYCYSQLLLFLPWLDEETELLNLSSYQSHYDENLVIIENNRSVLEQHADIISIAVEQFEENGPPVHAFDDIAPNTIQENDEDSNIQDDELFAILNPEEIIPAETPSLSEILVASSNTSSVEIRPGFWTEEDYFQHIRKLNAEQRDTFQTVYKWCHEKSIYSKTDYSPEPLFLFVSGGAGTGKSHLISAIYQMALRHLQTEGENPENIQVLPTAPTGTAAHNISGTTLHSAFLLPLGQTNSFMKLSDDKRNTLRSKLGNLQLLIIDEISMVGCNVFLQLHYRLSEIRSTKKLFGGVSIIVFGDLYQLPPVRQKFIFKPVSDQIARLHGSLWQDFLLVELTKVMRQKEDFCFAEMLNRIRTASHTHDDLQVLQSRIVSQSDEHNPALHVFARNCDVDEYNMKQLNSLKHPVETLVAIDKKPKGLENYQPKNDSKFTGGLPSEIQLALGARVMLTRNIDIGDGLVNRVQGQVVGFITSQRTTPPKKVAILVRFDSSNTGQDTRLKSQFTLELGQHPDATPILRVEASFTVARKNANLKISRYQFPLKLSWACTIHKVQGLTLDSIFISFDHRFTSGQAYVALSRAKTLQGMHLLTFDERKLIANTEVKKEMRRLQEDKKCPAFYDFLIQWESSLIVAVLNVRSYNRHRQDVANDPLFTGADLIIFTETWLCEQITNENIFPADYFCVRSDKPATRQQSQAGGVAVLAKRSMFTQCYQLLCYKDHFLQITCVELTLKSYNTVFAIGVYNSPSSLNSPRASDAKLLNVIHRIKSLQNPCSIICTGDFNQNIRDNQHSHILDTLTMEGFIQHVATPTHVSGSCLDHFYTYNLQLSDLKTIGCYYSDHDWVISSIKCESHQN